MMREPVAQLAHEAPPEVETALVRHLGAHETGDVQHMTVLTCVAVTWAKARRFHPGFLLCEVLPGVINPDVERCDQLLVGGAVRQVEQMDKFSMDRIDLGISQLQIGSECGSALGGGWGHGRNLKQPIQLSHANYQDSKTIYFPR